MDPEEVKPSPMQQETQMFDYLRANFTTNPKKLKKLARRLAEDPATPGFISNGLLTSIVLHKEPVKFLRRMFRQIEEWPALIEGLISDGNHGMIIIERGDNEVIYPCKIDTRANWLRVNDKWNPEDERLIQLDLAQGWMKEHNKGYIHCKVVLFQPFGFSGIPREIEQRCVKDTSQLTRFENTNYFVK